MSTLPGWQQIVTVRLGTLPMNILDINRTDAVPVLVRLRVYVVQLSVPDGDAARNGVLIDF